MIVLTNKVQILKINIPKKKKKAHFSPKKINK